MGLRAIEEHDIFESVLPHIRDLRNQVKETVCYGVIGSEKILFIEQAIGTHPFCFASYPRKGDRSALFGTGQSCIGFYGSLDKRNLPEDNHLRKVQRKHNYQRS